MCGDYKRELNFPNFETVRELQKVWQPHYEITECYESKEEDYFEFW